jgi:hypothetical protein
MELSNSTIIQSITPEALVDTFRQIVREELQNLHETPEKKKYNTRSATAKKLFISEPTLDKYTNSGLITGLRMGTRILYSDEAIESALREIPLQKYRRK